MNEIERIQELEQQLAEAKKELSTNKRKQIKYGLVWEDKTEEIEEILRTHFPILEEVESRRIDVPEPKPDQVNILSDNCVDNVEQPTNLLIEGDNLAALTTLQYTHKGKVDVIYIDPPYFTGNIDFRYNDNFVDRNDSYAHSTWLSFIEKRIRLSKALLKETGVIFISIDDNEIAQLKLLCNEVFGGNNFATQFVWENNPKGRKNGTFHAQSHEYILVYVKNSNLWGKKNNGLEFLKVVSTIDGREIHYDEHGAYKKGKRQVLGTNSNPHAKDNPSRCFVLYHNPETKRSIILDEYDASTDSIPPSSDGKMLENEGYVRYVPVNKSTNRPNIVTYTRHTIETMLRADDLIFTSTSIYQKERDFNQKAKSILTSELLEANILTETAGQELRGILHNTETADFPFPKPVPLIMKLISLHPFTDSRDMLILDFFAGSGTTGHAVMELNKEDGGNRQFILCTNNENNICEEVTYERLKRVMEGYTTPKGKTINGLGGKLRYYKCIADAIENPSTSKTT